ncbi:hypothetical protein [Thermus tengchongensis]|uniref:hypothetical protein n=1 Tax=Thermus tengchongensis TaxID=1214928 RepID=UPI001F25910F|nr:hypothetical protein [Thermus tengchongensis]
MSEKPDLPEQIYIPPDRVTPVYVSGVVINQNLELKILTLGLLSGMPLPKGNSTSEHAMHLTLTGAYAFTPPQAKFLYETLKQFLQAVGEEV